MTGPYGISITGDVAVITLSVPALWWVAVTLLAGLFLTWTTVREWVGGVLARVWKEDREGVRIGSGSGSPTDKQADRLDQIRTPYEKWTEWDLSKGPTSSGGTRTWE